MNEEQKTNADNTTENAPAADTENKTPDTKNDEAPSQSPIEKELDRVKQPKTEREKAEYTLKSTAQRLKTLGADPAKILGVEAPPPPKTEDGDSNDEVPEWYKKEQAKNASKGALEMADSIEDLKERELVKHQLEHVITSGTPEERVRVARGYVNSVKNARIAEEAGRGNAPKGHNSGSGAPPKNDAAGQFTPSAEEASMMHSFGLTEKDVLEARKTEAAAAK